MTSSVVKQDVVQQHTKQTETFGLLIIGLLLDLSSAFGIKAQSMSTYNELTEWNYVILNLQLLNGVFNAFLKIASDGDCLIVSDNHNLL